ncbi:MAG: L-histidine N(alpha)-methyltransferase [Planctomycetota bacterium]
MARIDLVTPEELETRLRDSLERRELPDYFLYLGEAGTGNWLELDHSDDFPVARALTDLLAASVPAIVRHLAPETTLLSIGVGDGRKERLLLEAMAERGSPRYVAVDISSPMVDEALAAVADLSIDSLGITGFCDDLPVIRDHAEPPRLVALLGNNFCNYEPDRLLALMAEELGPDDLLLFDAHVLPGRAGDEAAWRSRVERAYRSPANVRFNLGPLLAHGMEPEACSFRLDLLPLDTPQGEVLRTRKRIDVLADARLRFPDGTVELTAGDTIAMGFTYKYSAPQVERRLRRHGFEILDRFTSEAADNLLVLTRPPSMRGAT